MEKPFLLSHYTLMLGKLKFHIILFALFYSINAFTQTGKLSNELKKSSINRFPNSDFYYSTDYEKEAKNLFNEFEEIKPYILKSFSLDTFDLTVAYLSKNDFYSIKEIKKSNYPTWFKKTYIDRSGNWYGHTIILSAEKSGRLRDYFLAFKEQFEKADTLGLTNFFGSFENCIDKNFDIILYHELGHYIQDKLGISKNFEWSNEFFANMFAYSIIKQNYPQYTNLWGIYGEMILAKFKGRYSSLQEIDKIAKKDGTARMYMQALLFYTSKEAFENDDKLLSNLLTEKQFKERNDWNVQMNLFEKYIPNFKKKIENLEYK